VLLAIVQAIPEEHVRQCFEMDYESFLSMLNIVCLNNVKHISVLQNMVGKYEKWKQKDFPFSLPDYVSVPIQAMKRLFECPLPKETLVLKVHEIEGDGNCLYRSLSESTVVREHIPKFKSYQAMELHKYVREVM
jgi:hypothetical protein